MWLARQQVSTDFIQWPHIYYMSALGKVLFWVLLKAWKLPDTFFGTTYMPSLDYIFICLKKTVLFHMFPVHCSAAAAAKSLQSRPTLCDPIDGSPPGSPVPGILQTRTLEWAAISFSNAWKWNVKVKSLSRVRLLATPWTAAHQAPPSVGFSRQEYWSGVPLPSLVHCSREYQISQRDNNCIEIWRKGATVGEYSSKRGDVEEHEWWSWCRMGLKPRDAAGDPVRKGLLWMAVHKWARWGLVKSASLLSCTGGKWKSSNKDTGWF